MRHGIDLTKLHSAKKKAPKYRNTKTNGYDSKKESRRAMDLKQLVRAGEIHELKEQQSFLLIPKQGKERSVSYVADFTYIDKFGNFVVEDAKGMRTSTYIIKRKLMLSVHGIVIREI